MGIVQVPDYTFLWSSNKYLGNAGVKEIMPVTVRHRSETESRRGLTLNSLSCGFARPEPFACKYWLIFSKHVPE
jgi:hypothetical protein